MSPLAYLFMISILALGGIGVLWYFSRNKRYTRTVKILGIVYFLMLFGVHVGYLVSALSQSQTPPVLQIANSTLPITAPSTIPAGKYTLVIEVRKDAKQSAVTSKIIMDLTESGAHCNVAHDLSVIAFAHLAQSYANDLREKIAREGISARVIEDDPSPNYEPLKSTTAEK